MAMNLKFSLVFLSALYSLVVYGQQDKEPSGYMRREYSLIKPFNGKLNKVRDEDNLCALDIAPIIYLYVIYCILFEAWLYTKFAQRLFLVPGMASLQNWEILGSAVATDDFIRLTPDHQSKQGAVWNIIVSQAMS